MDSNLDNKKYSKLHAYEVVMISLYQLGGAKRRIYTEEIAYRAYKIKIEDFCWTLEKFRRFPNLESTRRTLFSLRKKKLVVGAYDSSDLNKDGWILTEKGLSECLDYKDYLDIKKNKSKPQQGDKSQVISIKRSDFYKSFINQDLDLDKKYDIYHVADFLKIRADNIPNLRETFFRVKTISQLVDQKVYEFLSYVEKRNSEILNADLLIIDSKVKSKAKKYLIKD
jgi:hypothetical protein